uniref:FERM domain-containing protein n=1 Tax=Meloidogyne javanica TaxID=6303 RepID=A0A915N423_MELJA
PKIFGLQYQMKATDTEKRMMRWIEPGRPIRRQLERWACRRGQKWATYEKLHTMQPAYAALLYIVGLVEVQQCEGYGEETFFCKDGNSLEEITLGCSLDWIFVIRRPSGTTQKFRWEEVRELVANKRKLSIKCGENLVTSVFYFEDNEMVLIFLYFLNYQEI